MTTKPTPWGRFEIDRSMPTKWECKIKEAEEDRPLSNLEKEKVETSEEKKSKKWESNAKIFYYEKMWNK